MAINDQELEQKLKDLDRAIELGETEEDMDQMDQESGIRSLQKAPSIKMASETPGEEFELEIKMMIKEFEDAVRDGYKGSFEDFANYYFSQKEMMKDRTMAMMGGRMKYAGGKTVFGDIAEMNVKDEIKSTGKDLMSLLSPSKIMDMLNKAGEGIKQIYFNLKSDSEREQLLKKIYQGTEVQEKKNGGRMQLAGGAKEYGLYEDVIPKRYPDPVTARIETEKEEAATKREQKSIDDKKGKPKPFSMDVQKIEALIKAAKEEKLKKAKGGVASILGD